MIPVWNSLFWIILLFASVTGIARSFAQESRGRMLYLYTLADPRALFLAKLLYNSILMLVLGLIGLAVYAFMIGFPVQNTPLFFLTLLLGCIGFSTVFTMISAIASKAGNNFTLMSILGFPVILPLLLCIIRLSKTAADGLAWSVAAPYVWVIILLNITVGSVGLPLISIPLARLMKGFSLKRNWWKLACVLLLAYTMTIGLLVPLAPGITAVSPSVLSTGNTFSVHLVGYNTHLKSGSESLQAWLYNGGQKVCAMSVVAQNEQEADAVFPPNLPLSDKARSMDMIVHTDKDGNMFIPNAITSIDTSYAAILQTCTPKVSSVKPDHFSFPFRHILYESIRNLFFHVPMWFTMIALFSWGAFNSIRYLRTFDLKYDKRASELINTGLIFAVLGLVTGAIWARVTWGGWWPSDVKLNGAAISVLAYLAFIVLRNAMDDEHKRARIGAVYNILAYVMLIVLIGILPRINDSLHPGNGGNPGFNTYDLDNSLRAVFYTAVIGWVLLGFWIYQLRLRMRLVQDHIQETE